MITRVRGTEDVLDIRLYTFVLDEIKKHLSLHNFHQIDTPIIEATELFQRAIGQETDVVSKEMYIFQTVSGESICLRPEGTASIIRAYVENGLQDAPWKVYLHGPMFRHERPQKGRWRQFNQTSIEVIKAESIMHDVAMLKMLDTLFGAVFKLEHFVLQLNFLGCLEDRKKHKAALVQFLNDKQEDLCATCKVRKDKNTLRVFDCKNEQCKQMYQNAPKIIDFLCKECAKEWADVQQMLALLSVTYSINHFLVRGLDYYNKTVFEYSSTQLGAQSAFCGGGRYTLGKEVGARDDLQCVGVGIGMGRLMLLVEKNIGKLAIPHDQALHALIPMTKDQIPLVLLIAEQLRNNNFACEVMLQDASLSNVMKKANKMGAKFVLIMGPDEQAQHTVSVKNLLTGQSDTIKQSELVQFLKI